MMNMSVQNRLPQSGILKSEQAGSTPEAAAKGEGTVLPSKAEFMAVQIQILTADAAQEAWLKLENWTPSENKTPEQNIQDLKEQYLALKNYILESGEEALQAEMLAKLERVVVEHLEKMMGGQYGELTKFLTNSDQEPVLSAIKFSLLFFVLEKITQQDPVWPKEFSQQAAMVKHWDKGASIAERRPSEDNGMLQYGPKGKTRLHGASDPISQSLSSGQERGKPVQVQDPEGVVITYESKTNAYKDLFPKPFLPPELEKSLAFAKHMNAFNIAAPVTGDCVEKEEWIGLKAGVAWLKGQLFTTSPGVSKAMAYVMQRAVDYQVAASIRQASAALKSPPAAVAQPHGQIQPGAGGEAGPERENISKTFAPLEQRAVLAVYNYFVSSFTKTHDAKSTIMNSIFYMIEILKQKEQDGDYQFMLRYQNQRDNSEGAKGKTAESYMNENKMWFQKLKDSWDQYVRDLNFRGDMTLDFRRFQEQYSTWAQCLPPSTQESPIPKVSRNTLVGWCAVGLLILAALVYFINR